MYANYTFWHKIIRIKLDHLYRFATYVSFISITDNNINSIIVSSQIGIPNVSPNLTDALIGPTPVYAVLHTGPNNVCRHVSQLLIVYGL